MQEIQLFWMFFVLAALPCGGYAMPAYITEELAEEKVAQSRGTD